MRLKLWLSTLCLGGFLLGGCASITSFQTAKTLKAGDHVQNVSVTYSKNLRLKLSTSDDGTIQTNGYGIDYMYRYGLTDVDEVGGRINLLGYIMADYKRALLTDGSMPISAGLGIGGTNFTTTSGVGTNTVDTSTLNLDFTVPVYVDFVIDEASTVYFSPRYVFTLVHSSSGSISESDHASKVGANLGYKFGKGPAGFMVEVAYLRNLSASAPVATTAFPNPPDLRNQLQFGVGFGFQ